MQHNILQSDNIFTFLFLHSSGCVLVEWKFHQSIGHRRQLPGRRITIGGKDKVRTYVSIDCNITYDDDDDDGHDDCDDADCDDDDYDCDDEFEFIIII